MASSSDLPNPLRAVNGTRVVTGGKTFHYFAGCDYLGLSWHPEVRRALAQAAKHHGLSVGASRTTTGNRPLLVELEAALAKFFATPTATVFSSGYLADIAAAQALAGDFDRVLIDERSHSAPRDSLRFLEAPVTPFRHRDAGDLARKVRRAGRRTKLLVVTDGMFAFDGSLAPLRDYLRVLPPKAWLLVDDAHAAGIVGKNGRGSPEHWGLTKPERGRIVQTISLSKAFGAVGGGIVGTEEFRHALLAKSKVFAGATPLSPLFAAAVLASLKIIATTPVRAQMGKNLGIFRDALGELPGPALSTHGPVVAVFPENQSHLDSIREKLVRARIYPNHIRYPGGPPTGFFRFTLGSTHTRRQILALVKTLKAVL